MFEEFTEIFLNVLRVGQSMKDGQQAGLNLLDGDQQEQRFCDEKKQ